MSRFLITNHAQDEIAAARALADEMKPARKLFVVGPRADVTEQREALHDFEFVDYGKMMDAENVRLRADTSARDLWVMHHTCPGNIMCPNLNAIQKVAGVKLAVEEHPFQGKAWQWHFYFPLSFVDKSILGYPHAYAFRDATDPDAFDMRRLADKAAESTTATFDRLFSDIETIEVSLTADELNGYERLKDEAFEVEQTPNAIIRRLKKYVDATPSMMSATGKTKHLNLLEHNKIWGAYKAGVRTRVVSDAKVDTYLAGEFDNYITAANMIMEHLYNG